MAGIDFYLDDNSDIQIVNGKFVFLETIPQSVRQRLQTKFRAWKGEWFLNTTYGIPYREGVYGGVFSKGILGKGYSKSDIDAIYVSAALEDPDVIRVTFFNSTLNRVSRMYDVTMDVLTVDGLIRLDIPSFTPNDEVEYPEPPEFIISPDCGADNIPMNNGDAFVQTENPQDFITPNNHYILFDGSPSIPYMIEDYVEDGYVV